MILNRDTLDFFRYYGFSLTAVVYLTYLFFYYGLYLTTAIFLFYLIFEKG